MKPRFMILNDTGYKLITVNNRYSSACSCCVFQSCTTASCQELPLSCGTSSECFTETNTASDEFLLAQLKGEVVR